MNTTLLKARQKQLASISTLAEKYSFVAPDACDQILKCISSLLERNNLAKSLDIADMTSHEVRQLISTKMQKVANENEWVFLVWNADRICVQLKLHDCIKHYDDLWFPSRDDVWIVNKEGSWLIEITHEELLRIIFADENTSYEN